MKVAIVSTDGMNVNEHFGKAKRFLIYHVSDDKLFLDESRPSESLSMGNLKHTFDPDRFNRVLTVIKDCRKVFAVRIGITPASKLLENGIEPVIYKGSIDDIPSNKLM